MKLHLLEKLGIALVLGLGAMLIAPLRYALLGLVKHEPFYYRRPTSYWLKILKDDDARHRQWAALTLGDIGAEPGVVPALIEALNDKDFEVHRVVLTSLGTIGSAAKEAVPALNEALRHGDVETRGAIGEVLAKIDPEAAAKAGIAAAP